MMSGSMHSTTTVTLVDSVRVVVPDTLDLITPYVLQEQQDWFEDEIKFLRRLLRPGQRVIDIGANYGVYALSMAQAVGPAGRVWAFEPASGTAKLLAAGIAANGFAHVSLERSALSSASGSAQLALQPDPEMNALVRGEQPGGPTETVPVLTLDECLDSRAWRDIEFVKIDAEGEEAGILEGGPRFFARESPLIQYEVKAGKDLHLELVEAFAALGYGSYRLVPGLDLLVPFDAGAPVDGFLLNLFCCKPDRAARLAAAGFLVEGRAPLQAGQVGGAQDWRSTLAKLPYAARLAASWERTVAAGKSREAEEALSLYAASREASRPAAERFAALEAGFVLLRALCAGAPAYLRLFSLARLARDYGAREVAAQALARLGESLLQVGEPDPGEPFLAPGQRFDSVRPREALGEWIVAASLEEFERAGSYSSFYTGMAARQRLEVIRKLGYGSAEMQRRLSLLQRRFGLPT
jgi:FkbM family methyltransferase